MCDHPDKQICNSQLASHGRIITPSFHLSSILMAERDKQSVNAPGVCVITRCMLAKALTWLHPVQMHTHTHTHTHTDEEKHSQNEKKNVFSTSVRLQLSREDSRRERTKQKARQEREGGSKQVGVRLVSVHLSSPS